MKLGESDSQRRRGGGGEEERKKHLTGAPNGERATGVRPQWGRENTCEALWYIAE